MFKYDNNKIWHSSNQFELHNYFDSLTKLFSELYLAKFSDTSVKLSFSCATFYYSVFYAWNKICLLNIFFVQFT